MKATKITYKKLFNLGNYQHEEIGIELEIEKGETAAQVLAKAKQFVNGFNPNDSRKREYNQALQVLANKDNHIYKDVQNALKLVDAYNKDDTDNLPF
jgi:SLT domain-containing protein